MFKDVNKNLIKEKSSKLEETRKVLGQLEHSKKKLGK